MKDLKWFQFNQNNSNGTFDVDDKVCHRLFIEAESFKDAIKKAEELGCYWDGVEKGIDCECCGDRWSAWNDTPVDIEEYEAVVLGDVENDIRDEWEKKYHKYEVIEEPKYIDTYYIKKCIGKIRFNNIEEYAQHLSDEFGWTAPDARIYYNDGNVKEIF